MSDVALAEPHRAALPAPPDDKPKRMQVRGKLKAALDAMVWEGMTYDAAAREYKFTVSAMRKALQRPHVLAYLMTERQVLRASVAPKNIHRLVEIRDAADNMPAVNAIKVLEQLGDEQTQRGSGVSSSPGVTIRILNVVQGETRTQVDVRGIDGDSSNAAR